MRMLTLAAAMLLGLAAHAESDSLATITVPDGQSTVVTRVNDQGEFQVQAEDGSFNKVALKEVTSQERQELAANTVAADAEAKADMQPTCKDGTCTIRVGWWGGGWGGFWHHHHMHPWHHWDEGGWHYHMWHHHFGFGGWHHWDHWHHWHHWHGGW